MLPIKQTTIQAFFLNGLDANHQVIRYQTNEHTFPQ